MKDTWMGALVLIAAGIVFAFLVTWACADGCTYFTVVGDDGRLRTCASCCYGGVCTVHCY